MTSTLKQRLISQNQLDNAIDSIKSNQLPTLLYGAGVYAVEVEKFLDAMQVKVVGCIIDAAYADKPRLYQGELFTAEKLAKSAQKYNVVIAFCGKEASLMSRF